MTSLYLDPDRPVIILRFIHQLVKVDGNYAVDGRGMNVWGRVPEWNSCYHLSHDQPVSKWGSIWPEGKESLYWTMVSICTTTGVVDWQGKQEWLMSPNRIVGALSKVATDATTGCLAPSGNRNIDTGSNNSSSNSIISQLLTLSKFFKLPIPNGAKSDA